VTLGVVSEGCRLRGRYEVKAQHYEVPLGSVLLYEWGRILGLKDGV
jgi:hypothetical protein